jgi:hypothetical protein
VLHQPKHPPVEDAPPILSCFQLKELPELVVRGVARPQHLFEE